MFHHSHRAAPGLLALALALATCGDDADHGTPPAPEPAVPWTPELGETRQILPGPHIDTGFPEAKSNNNLDVVSHDGAIYLATRAAPHHFADPEARIHVFRSTDEITWTHEASFHMDTDLREPRLLSWDGQLLLYFAVLGRNRRAFEPQGSRLSQRREDGTWTEPAEVLSPDFIPWRTRVEDGRPWLIGYTGGEEIYADVGGELEVQVLTSADGVSWEPAFGKESTVLRGGGSETDAVLLPDGRLVAVARNESGDETGYGSHVCTAAADALGQWTCDNDPRKFDSPLLFEHRGTAWLVARRQLAHDGLYDLGRDDLRPSTRYWTYQWEYWQSPKRCALWTVDPDTREVEWVVDLPSRGDTCFPGVIWLDEDRVAIYNYSSPIDGRDVTWQQGQDGQTSIYRTEVTFTAPAAA